MWPWNCRTQLNAVPPESGHCWQSTKKRKKTRKQCGKASKMSQWRIQNISRSLRWALRRGINRGTEIIKSE